MSSLRILNFFITLLCIIGLGCSIYAYVVELSIEMDKNYQPMCDISEGISCSKAFRSPYGKGFGLVQKWLGKGSIFNEPNSLFGMIYYSLLATITQTNSIFITKVALLGSILALCSSIYFAYILYFVLQNLCIVCVTTYVVNTLSLIMIYYKLRNVTYSENMDRMKKKN